MSKAKQIINSLLLNYRKMLSHSQESRDHHIQRFIGKKTPHSKCFPLLLSLLQRLLTSMTPFVMGYSFRQFKTTALSVSSPGSLCMHISSLAGQQKESKTPWLCISTALQQQKHHCAIPSIFMKNPRHGIIYVAMKKKNNYTKLIKDFPSISLCSLPRSPLQFTIVPHSPSMSHKKFGKRDEPYSDYQCNSCKQIELDGTD